MNLDDFAIPLAEICAHSAVAPGRALRWTVVANPGAGGFTIASRWKQHSRTLAEAAAKAGRLNPRRADSGSSAVAGNAGTKTGLVATEGPGHARRVMGALFREAEAHSDSFFPVICAGGDGTSLEVLAELYAAPEALRERFVVLRLPMGTGNDGADSRDLGEALELLYLPSTVGRSAALRLVTATPGKGPFLAFNILSVGLDAFVTHNTNLMKGKMPGDSYKLWVDVAALLYDRIYRVGPMDVSVFYGNGNDNGNAALTAKMRETVLLLAVGVSGHRSYGAGNLILPDDRNVCLVRQMSLFRKLALKGKFKTGEHAVMKECVLFNADRVEFSGQHPILAQMDGETVLLEPGDFPAAIERGAPVIPVLKRGNA